MMVIRPVERGDLAGLMQLAGKTGGGLTSLPADEKTLSARIERALQTWQGTLPKSEQGYVFVLEDTDTGTVAGICAIEVAVGLNDPWYNAVPRPGVAQGGQRLSALQIALYVYGRLPRSL